MQNTPPINTPLLLIFFSFNHAFSLPSSTAHYFSISLLNLAKLYTARSMAYGKRPRQQAEEAAFSLFDSSDMARIMLLFSGAHGGGGGAAAASPPERMFECKTCNRQFPSFQALGGHRASHKKPAWRTATRPPRRRPSPRCTGAPSAGSSSPSARRSEGTCGATAPSWRTASAWPQPRPRHRRRRAERRRRRQEEGRGRRRRRRAGVRPERAGDRGGAGSRQAGGARRRVPRGG